MSIPPQTANPTSRPSSEAVEVFLPSLPRNPQAKSALLLLPSEIRVKILRCLLRRGDPIHSAGELVKSGSKKIEEVKEPFYASLSLSSQVLRVCQLLLEDGEPILYKENLLSMTYGSFSGTMPRLLYFLDCEMDPSSYSRQPPHVARNCFDGRTRMLHSLNTQLDDSRNVLAYSTLKRFQHVRLTVDICQLDTIFHVCSFLQQLLFDKDVSLLVVQESHRRPLEEHVIIANLRACQRLCCRSFKIHYPSSTEGAAERLKEIEKVVTGPNRPYDPLIQWKIFNRNILYELGHISASSFTQKNCVSVVELRRSAIEFDSAKFKALRLKCFRKRRYGQKIGL